MFGKNVNQDLTRHVNKLTGRQVPNITDDAAVGRFATEVPEVVPSNWEKSAATVPQFQGKGTTDEQVSSRMAEQGWKHDEQLRRQGEKEEFSREELSNINKTEFNKMGEGNENLMQSKEGKQEGLIQPESELQGKQEGLIQPEGETMKGKEGGLLQPEGGMTKGTRGDAAVREWKDPGKARKRQTKGKQEGLMPQPSSQTEGNTLHGFEQGAFHKEGAETQQFEGFRDADKEFHEGFKGGVLPGQPGFREDVTFQGLRANPEHGTLPHGSGRS